MNALISMMGGFFTGLDKKDRSPEAQRDKKGLSGLLERLGPRVQNVLGGLVASSIFKFNPLIGVGLGLIRGVLPKINPRGMFGKGGSGADSLGGRGVEGVPAFTNFGRYADRMDATKFSVEGVPRFVGTGGVQSHPFAIGAQPEPEKKRGFFAGVGDWFKGIFGRKDRQDPTAKATEAHTRSLVENGRLRNDLIRRQAADASRSFAEGVRTTKTGNDILRSQTGALSGIETAGLSTRTSVEDFSSLNSQGLGTANDHLKTLSEKDWSPTVTVNAPDVSGGTTPTGTQPTDPTAPARPPSGGGGGDTERPRDPRIPERLPEGLSLTPELIAASHAGRYAANINTRGAIADAVFQQTGKRVSVEQLKDIRDKVNQWSDFRKENKPTYNRGPNSGRGTLLGAGLGLLAGPLGVMAGAIGGGIWGASKDKKKGLSSWASPASSILEGSGSIPEFSTLAEANAHTNQLIQEAARGNQLGQDVQANLQHQGNQLAAWGVTGLGEVGKNVKDGTIASGYKFDGLTGATQQGSHGIMYSVDRVGNKVGGVSGALGTLSGTVATGFTGVSVSIEGLKGYLQQRQPVYRPQGGGGGGGGGGDPRDRERKRVERSLAHNQRVNRNRGGSWSPRTPSGKTHTDRAWSTGFSSGGYISGAGGPTSDLIPAMLSNGEFVINAASTRKFLPLLEKINSGDFQGFSTGGYVGSPSERSLGLGRELSGWLTRQISELDELNTMTALKKELQERISKTLIGVDSNTKEGSKSIVEKIAEVILSLGGVKTAIGGIRLSSYTPSVGSPTLGQGIPDAPRGKTPPTAQQLRDDNDRFIAFGKDLGRPLIHRATPGRTAEDRKKIGDMMRRVKEKYGHVVNFSNVQFFEKTLKEIESQVYTLISNKDAEMQSRYGFGAEWANKSMVAFGRLQSYMVNPKTSFSFRDGSSLRNASSRALDLRKNPVFLATIARLKREARERVKSRNLPLIEKRRLSEGGYISGAGGPTSDSIPAMLSNGEYVINSASTRKFLPLLEKINSGDFKGFATGGGPGFTSPTPTYSTGERELGLARELSGWMVKQIAELKDIKTSSKTSKDFLNAIGKILFDTKAQNKAGTQSIVSKIAEQIMNLGGVKTAIQGLRIGGPAPAGGGGRSPDSGGGSGSGSGSPTSGSGGRQRKTWAQVSMEVFGRVRPYIVRRGETVTFKDGSKYTIRSQQLDLRDAYKHRFSFGGFVSGPGSSISDSIPAMLSNGEFVINAAATRKFKPLLEKINDGSYEKKMLGGAVGVHTPSARPVQETRNTDNSTNVVVNLRIDGNVTEQTRREVHRMIPEIAHSIPYINQDRGRSAR